MSALPVEQDRIPPGLGQSPRDSGAAEAATAKGGAQRIGAVVEDGCV